MARLPYIKEYTDDCGIRRRYFRTQGISGRRVAGPHRLARIHGGLSGLCQRGPTGCG